MMERPPTRNRRMYFCIRDDDTSFFTSPEELDRLYGELTELGPVSLAVVPFHRAGRSKGVPAKFRGRWSVHPLHDNQELVDYLRAGVAAGRFEIMLHGYYHDEPDGRQEFEHGTDLVRRVAEGRSYLETLLGATIRVFVPPRNAIGRQGLSAIAAAGLHLGGTAGFRRGWSLVSRKTWPVWWQLRKFRRTGGLGVPWVLDLGDHREIAGNAITPVAHMRRNHAAFDCALAMNGVFCAATHYWELETPSEYSTSPTVGGQLRQLIARATSDPRVRWRSVGDVVSSAPAIP
jgi:hypothetical protein